MDVMVNGVTIECVTGRLLEACYRNALRLAERGAMRSIAFPAISIGAFGYPMRDAAEIAIGSVLEATERVTRVERIRFVLYDQAALDVHEQVLGRLLAERRKHP